ncbi:MAG: ribonuclease H-like domain-containing protein [Nanoarchaeota archaeon]|nr:ribonuclease H-like domain-containing protein [Nanoarchaeota archaeon]
MIRNSFIFLKNIREQMEKNLWEVGIHTWSDFLDAKDVPGISKQKKYFYDAQLEKAQKNLEVENMAYFAAQLPSVYHWRLYDHFKEEIVYLDIETGSRNDNITVIGLSDGVDTKIMLKGQNMHREILLDELSKHKILVTFNGGTFDVPILQKYFGFKLEMPHIDLRHVCAKIGLNGGLKEIEKKLGINRPEELECLRGHNAVELWKMWCVTHEERFLDLLIKYNEEDILNLKPIADHAINELWKRTKGF